MSIEDQASPADDENRSESCLALENVSEVIRKRKTVKVLADPKRPVLAAEGCGQQLQESDLANDGLVRQAIELAGWAPFHYARDVDNLAEPWRFHVLWRAQCQEIASLMPEWFDDMKPNNKLPAMLSACGALVIVNWLPQFDGAKASVDEPVSKEKQQQVDEEHLAATAVAVQNTMLALTAGGLGTYWSSGGMFRKSTMFEKLGISSNERLLAAIFVDYGQQFTNSAVTERITGKHRSSRSHFSEWTREIELDG